MIRDKLTKKRKRVDYLLVVAVLNLETEFFNFQVSHKKKIKTSLNRQARCFVMHKKIPFENIYNDYVLRGIDTYEKYQNECIRLACDHSWIEED